MEKLSIRLIIFLIGISFTYGQDTLCVFKTKGTSLIEIESQQQSIKKGDLIAKNDIVSILPNSEITTIDNSGNVYLITVAGTYNLKNLLNFKSLKQKSNFTAKYFKHVWNELQSNRSDEAIIAGVFRGDALMLFPKDSSLIASSKITIKWRTEEADRLYYIFIKNLTTKEIIKIETNGSQLGLYDENLIFNEGNTFEWAVTTDAFPSIKNLMFYSFSIIDRNEYEASHLFLAFIITFCMQV